MLRWHYKERNHNVRKAKGMFAFPSLKSSTRDLTEMRRSRGLTICSLLPFAPGLQEQRCQTLSRTSFNKYGNIYSICSSLLAKKRKNKTSKIQK
ncbi:hypothetical protein LEMLEM_LOCUS6963 [Lemmus lemmus]